MRKLNPTPIARAGLIVAVALLAVEASRGTHTEARQASEITQIAGALRYRALNFTRGGRVTAVVGVPTQPLIYYFGSTGGGVWKTPDAGTTWRNISDGTFEAGSVGAIAVADSDPNVVYVGTGSACPRNNISVGVGMYRSRDAGRSWTHIGLREAGQIGRIRIDPADSNHLYVAVLGSVFGPSDQRGVYRSKNGGDTWERVLFVNDKTGAVDLSMDPKFPRVLYASVWAFDRKPWGVTSTSREAGIYKSEDGGDTWRRLRNGLPSDVAIDRSAVAVSPGRPGRVWALVDTERFDGGLYRSDDGGENWVLVNRDRELVQRAFYYMHLYTDPVNPDTLYVMNVAFHKSVDGGTTFQRVPAPHSDHHDLWVNPLDPQKIINANDGGATVSFTGGTSWSTQDNQPTAEIYRVSVDDQYPYRVYGAQQDNTTVSLSSAQRSTVPWHSVGGTEAAHIAVDPHDPDSVWATAYWGEVTRMDMKTRVVEASHPYPEWLTGRRVGDVKYRYNWNAPLRVSRHTKDTVWTASQYIHRTRNRGQSWEVISPDLTGTGDSIRNHVDDRVRSSSSFEPWGSVFAFEESTTTPGLLWAGSDDGLVHVSRDDGASWTNVTPPGMPDGGTVNMVDPSVHAPGRAHIAVYRYMQGDFSPYIFQTNDFGRTWRRLADGTNGVPPNHPVRVVREDTRRRGLLYAGTEFGMYFSTDDGARWQSLQLNLPATPVTDLAIHRKDLIVTTQGRGFWILDDLSPLHAIAAGRGEPTRDLLPPRDVHRGVSDGATIWYRLTDTPKAPVTVEIRDGSGRLVTRAQSRGGGTQGSRGGPTTNQGLNRFDWNLRYDPPFQVPSGVGLFAALGPGFAGPQAPPGAYTVTVVADPWKETETLTVLSDPRAPATQADYDAQLDLALQIGARTRTLYDMLATVRDLQKQARAINDRPEAASADVRRPIQTLLTDLIAIEEKLAQTRATGSQDTAPSKLDSQFVGLYGRVIGHQGRPTGPEFQRLADLDPALASQRETLEQLIGITLPALNKTLTAHRIIPIQVTGSPR